MTSPRPLRCLCACGQPTVTLIGRSQNFGCVNITFNFMIQLCFQHHLMQLMTHPCPSVPHTLPAATSTCNQALLSPATLCHTYIAYRGGPRKALLKSCFGGPTGISYLCSSAPSLRAATGHLLQGGTLTCTVHRPEYFGFAEWLRPLEGALARAAEEGRVHATVVLLEPRLEALRRLPRANTWHVDVHSFGAAECIRSGRASENVAAR